jgi:hypothetical protein
MKQIQFPVNINLAGDLVDNSGAVIVPSTASDYDLNQLIGRKIH